jgi:hypothetical protein
MYGEGNKLAAYGNCDFVDFGDFGMDCGNYTCGSNCAYTLSSLRPDLPCCGNRLALCN